jgi:hypothetical protein
MHLADGLFPLVSRCGVDMPFKKDQLIDRILTCDAFDQVAFVIEHAIDKLVGYSHVERTVTLAGEDKCTVAYAHDCKLSPCTRTDASAVWCIGMTGERDEIDLTAVDENSASSPLTNSQGVAGIATFEVVEGILPAEPGVPISPEP